MRYTWNTILSFMKQRFWNIHLSNLIAADTNIRHTKLLYSITYRLRDERRIFHEQSWKHADKQNNMDLIRDGQWKFLVWGEARGIFLEVEEEAKHSRIYIESKINFIESRKCCFPSREKKLILKCLNSGYNTSWELLYLWLVTIKKERRLERKEHGLESKLKAFVSLFAEYAIS